MTQQATHHALRDVLAQCERGMLTRKRLLMVQQGDEATNLEAALLDAVDLFEALDIQYALVGGLAAMVYGKSRFTEDVDFVANEGHMDVLDQNPQTMAQYGFDPSCTWKLYHRSGIAVDLWKDQFANAIIERAHTIDLANRSVHIASMEDLVAMKLRADRPQDEYDISEILKAHALDAGLLSTLLTVQESKRLSEIRKRIGQEES